MDCSEIVPNRHFVTVLNKHVLISFLELLLFLAIETRVAAGKLWVGIKSYLRTIFATNANS